MAALELFYYFVAGSLKTTNYRYEKENQSKTGYCSREFLIAQKFVENLFGSLAAI